MVTRNSQLFQSFDALAFEEQRYQIFQQTETSTSLCNSALDADWDARLGYEPTEEQWHDVAYRESYLKAIASKYDEKYHLI